MARRRSMQVTFDMLLDNHGLRETWEQAEPGGIIVRIFVPGFERLVLERHSKNLMSIAHYWECNGDQMSDPWMTFDVNTWHVRDYVQDGMPWGGTRRQHVPQGYYSKDLEHFARAWARNLRDQGFTNPKRARVEIVTL